MCQVLLFQVPYVGSCMQIKVVVYTSTKVEYSTYQWSVCITKLYPYLNPEQSMSVWLRLYFLLSWAFIQSCPLTLKLSITLNYAQKNFSIFLNLHSRSNFSYSKSAHHLFVQRPRQTFSPAIHSLPYKCLERSNINDLQNYTNIILICSTQLEISGARNRSYPSCPNNQHKK